MLIGLVGTPGSGTEGVIKVLCEKLNFQLVGTESHSDELTQLNTDIESSRLKLCSDDAELLNYVTTNWRENFVLHDISELSNLDMFLKRPFFLLVSVDASLLIKFERFKLINPNTTLEEFCRLTDKHLLSVKNRHYKFQDEAKIKLINNSKNFKSLSNSLLDINLMNPERLRPKWDSYFMHFADLAAMRSNCMKRRVGCVIVKNNRILATGYNGTPRGCKNCNEGGCYRCNHPTAENSGVGLSTCLCLHAEENALLEAGRSRVEENAVLYCNTCPCLTCTIKIVQMGITEVVYSQSYSMDAFSEKVFKEAGVKFRQFIPPTYGTVILE